MLKAIWRFGKHCSYHLHGDFLLFVDNTGVTISFKSLEAKKTNELATN
jgi:hypothetical protein